MHNTKFLSKNILKLCCFKFMQTHTAHANSIWQVIIRETRSKLLVWKDKAPFRTRTTLFIKPADQEPGRLTSQRVIFSSVQFSRSVGANSLRPHESQHTRPPCPSPTPGVHSDSHPSSQWCHPALSSSVVPSPPAPNPSQHHSLFQWVNTSREVAKVLELQL